ncbi:MAG TPA: hypothetical protein VGO50_14955 [Pyrinomonadaceae bacterium]|jgi:hypothetical protein|nr:hypothetical protein [Pyrinomonadaceae bacterium]
MKTAKYLLPSFSRFFLIAAAILAFSLSAFAYEEDTHFQMTYVICRSVGFTADEALIVAAADQGMDDSPGVVANGDLGPLSGVIPNVTEEWKWHALDNLGLMGSSGVLARRDKFFETALTEPGGYLNKLIRLGVFFHFQQDTWGHRHHYKLIGNRGLTSYTSNHLSRSNYTTFNTPAGHAPEGHAPDRPPFDPVAAMLDLEQGIIYANRFLKEAMGREPGGFLANYDYHGGKDDSNWKKDKRKGAYFHQIDISESKKDNLATSYLRKLIRAQIDVYPTSITPNPRYTPYFTPDEANFDKMRAALEKIAKDFQPHRSAGLSDPTITIPTKAQKVAAGFTDLTTKWLEGQLAVESAITDGMRIHLRTNGAVYLAIDGKLRWISNPTAYKNLYNVSPLSRDMHSVDSVTRYLLGPPIPETYLANTPGDLNIYLVVDGTKRKFSRRSGLVRYGFNGNPRSLSKPQLAAIPDGPPIEDPGWPFFGKDGTSITSSDGKTYLIFDQQLHQVPGSATYDNLFGSGSATAATSSVKGYLIGEPLSDGAYLATSDRAFFYLVTNGKKYFINADFDRFGFDKNKIRNVGKAELDAIPFGLFNS